MNLSKQNMVLGLVFGITILIGIVFLVVPFSSKAPNESKKNTEDTIGYIKKEDFHMSKYTPNKDYTIKDLQQKTNINQYLGVAGIVIGFGAALFAGKLLLKRRKNF
ncbi:MAG: hypothetical protein MRJ65_07110 [Candidatus Brocadiaceae bacterium]|nr:hypothetical protein [Candidatus Brocadiaceae bacterium]